MRHRAAPLVAALVVVGGLSAANHHWKPVAIGAKTISFYGVHQSGVETTRQANATFVAFDVKKGVDLDAVARLMRVWSADAAHLTQGESIIGDSQPQMAENPARITVTFGFGRSLFTKLNREDLWPIAETSIPSFPIDKFEGRWDGGDLLVQVAGDNPIAIFHTEHELVREAAPFASVLWQQRGFVDASGINEGAVSRNLMGQIDGTLNAAPFTPEFAKTVWGGPVGEGTILVIRRIRMSLDTWDKLSPLRKEQSLGRKLEDGAPLNGGGPTASLIPTAAPSPGATEIAHDAHVRRALADASNSIVRRGWNYDDGYLADGTHDVGLIFTSFQSNLSSYLKIQGSLAEQDALNRWTTPVGSALFVLPEGVSEGEWVGHELLSDQ